MDQRSPRSPLQGVTHVPVEPLSDPPQLNEKGGDALDVGGGDNGDDAHHRTSEVGVDEHQRFADPSGIRVGKYNIPPRVVAPVCVVAIVGAAALLTFTTPVVNADPRPWDHISAWIGWVYFLAWGVSFLPQLYFNMRRWSVVGQSFEFVFLNVVGFMCYSTYTLCFYSNDAVKETYRRRYNGSTNTVTLNDVVFAVYALVCCLLNCLQIVFMDRGGQKLSRFAIALIGVIIFVVVLWTCLIAGGVRHSAVFNYLDLLYGLSLIKLGISIVKYLPQLYLNYKRKCTIGWNIWNILLDFTGGVLSILQQVIDSAVTNDWVGMTGNPVKFALGSVSILYDIVFILQHFVLYADNNKRFAEPVHERTPGGGDSEERPTVLGKSNDTTRAF
ncbi:cystinosin [Trypanosoma conorhini]|uniref:Cystinosin n=1 Tax=Trypanosoma conorhini TaxID=83891 RepID=A0A422PEM2_9TRYP|nr:cystinosin [Trypanosoma conorhini]RNF16167.1 cystinosin [Trypanosoma conorhini]